MRLKPVLLCCLAASVIAATAHAVAPAGNAAAPTATTASQSAPVPLLWKVSDADNALYLLGSFHLLKPGDYPLSPDVDAAFADAEAVVFELPPEEMGSPQLGMQMAQAALRLDGSPLNSELPAATVKKLDTWTAANAAELQKLSLQPQMLQMFEPWYVGLMVSVVGMTQQGLDPKLGLDAYFASAAGKANKPTSGLETGAQQVAFLDGMNKAEQLQFIDEALTQSAEGRQEMDKLYAAWRNGDAAALWTGMAADMRKQYPLLYQRINVGRNDDWVPKLEARLKQPGSDDVLVVVGALHLLGDDGVVEKLRRKGYAVERICSACKSLPQTKKQR